MKAISTADVLIENIVLNHKTGDCKIRICQNELVYKKFLLHQLNLTFQIILFQ